MLSSSASYTSSYPYFVGGLTSDLGRRILDLLIFSLLEDELFADELQEKPKTQCVICVLKVPTLWLADQVICVCTCVVHACVYVCVRACVCV